MIQSPEQFDAALEAATRQLDAPPPDGSPAHDRLMDLLQAIAAYRPRIRTPEPEADPAAQAERDRLARRLDDFEAQVTPHYGPHWAAMVGAPRE